MSQRLGDLLVKEKVITPEQLEQATKVQKENNCRLGSYFEAGCFRRQSRKASITTISSAGRSATS